MKQLLALGIFAIVTAMSPSVARAQSGTAIKTGEQTTGTTKQCYYSFAGKSYTHTVEAYQLCPLTLQVPLSIPQPSSTPAPAPTQFIAFKTGEQTTGSTKQCYYSGLGKAYTKTVEAYQLCPLSISVPSGS